MLKFEKKSVAKRLKHDDDDDDVEKDDDFTERDDILSNLHFGCAQI